MLSNQLHSLHSKVSTERTSSSLVALLSFQINSDYYKHINQPEKRNLEMFPWIHSWIKEFSWGSKGSRLSMDFQHLYRMLGLIILMGKQSREKRSAPCASVTASKLSCWKSMRSDWSSYIFNFMVMNISSCSGKPENSGNLFKKLGLFKTFERAFEKVLQTHIYILIFTDL